MKDLSLHLLDIAQNSVAAGAKHIDLTVVDTEQQITLTVKDDGCGMDAALLSRVVDPFTTTRTTRKLGMGIPLFHMAARQTGGGMVIESAAGEGTTVTARFQKNHIDCPPTGDLAETVALLVQGAPELEISYTRGSFRFDTKDVREILGQDISLATPEVTQWMREYLKENGA